MLLRLDVGFLPNKAALCPHFLWLQMSVSLARLRGSALLALEHDNAVAASFVSKAQAAMLLSFGIIGTCLYVLPRVPKPLLACIDAVALSHSWLQGH